MNNIAYINFRAQVHKKSVDMLMRAFGELVAKGTQNITLIVSSGGGQVQPALDFYDFAKGLPVTLTTCTVGQIASAAVVIYCAGEKRFSHSNTRFLIHGIRGSLPNVSIKDIESRVLKDLKSQSRKIAEIIAKATNKDVREIADEMEREKTLSAEEAEKYGLVTDGVDDSPIKKVGVPIVTIGDDLFK